MCLECGVEKLKRSIWNNTFAKSGWVNGWPLMCEFMFSLAKKKQRTFHISSPHVVVIRRSSSSSMSLGATKLYYYCSGLHLPSLCSFNLRISITVCPKVFAWLFITPATLFNVFCSSLHFLSGNMWMVDKYSFRWLCRNPGEIRGKSVIFF